MFYRTVQKFENTGSIEDAIEGRVGQSTTVTSEKTVERARELFTEQSSTSVRRGSQQLNISKSSLHSIMSKKLEIVPIRSKHSRL